jgi:hypothetical protein
MLLQLICIQPIILLTEICFFYKGMIRVVLRLVVVNSSRDVPNLKSKTIKFNSSFVGLSHVTGRRKSLGLYSEICSSNSRCCKISI